MISCELSWDTELLELTSSSDGISGEGVEDQVLGALPFAAGKSYLPDGVCGRIRGGSSTAG